MFRHLLFNSASKIAPYRRDRNLVKFSDRHSERSVPVSRYERNCGLQFYLILYTVTICTYDTSARMQVRGYQRREVKHRENERLKMWGAAGGYDALEGRPINFSLYRCVARKKLDNGSPIELARLLLRIVNTAMRYAAHRFRNDNYPCPRAAGRVFEVSRVPRDHDLHDRWYLEHADTRGTGKTIGSVTVGERIPRRGRAPSNYRLVDAAWN